MMSLRRGLPTAFFMLLAGVATAWGGDLESILAKGRQWVADGRLDDAVALFEDLLESAALADPRERAALATEIARLHHRAGRAGEAERFYARCLETLRGGILRGVVPAADPAAAACRYNLAGLAFEAGRHGEAQALYRAAYDAWGQSLGPGHAYTLEAGEELALLLRMAGELEEAAALYESLIAAHQTHHGAADPALPTLLDALAGVELERRRIAAAERHLHRALDVLREADGRPRERAGVLSRLAIVETRLGLLAQAEEHYRAALTLYDRHAPGHPDAAATRNNLALLYVQAERDDDAEPLLRRSLADAEKSGDPAALVPTLANLAALYDRLGRRADSLAMTRRAAAVLGPQLEVIAQRDPESLGPHESLWYELALLHRKNLAASGAPSTPSASNAPPPAPELRHPHDERLSAGVSAVAADDPYWAQIGSRPDAALAQRDLEALASTFPELLSGLPHRLQHADLGAKGVWHRMQFGPFAERFLAARLCAQLAERGYGECLVVREPQENGQ